MVTNSTGEILITGSSHGLLSFREVWSLQELFSIDMNESGAIRSLSFTEGFAIAIRIEAVDFIKLQVLMEVA